MSGKRIGKVTHYFDKIGVVVLDLTAVIRVGDTLHFLGHLTDFEQTVESLQIEHQAVKKAGPKQEVAMKVVQPVHPNTDVFKITAEK
jgi:putative protease